LDPPTTTRASPGCLVLLSIRALGNVRFGTGRTFVLAPFNSPTSSAQDHGSGAGAGGKDMMRDSDPHREGLRESVSTYPRPAPPFSRALDGPSRCLYGQTAMHPWPRKRPQALRLGWRRDTLRSTWGRQLGGTPTRDELLEPGQEDREGKKERKIERKKEKRVGRQYMSRFFVEPTTRDNPQA
jgi:hypothetical protein